MKTLKSILAFVFLFSSCLTFAQPGGGQGGQQGPPPIPSDKQIEQMVSNLADEISLTSEQETKILEIYRAHFIAVKAKTSGNSRPKREEMEALDTALAKNVKAELTDSQKSKYEAYLKTQSKKRPQGR